MIEGKQLSDRFFLDLSAGREVLEWGDVEGHHVLKDGTPGLVRLVGHGTMLYRSSEHDDVTRLGGQLDRLSEEIVWVFWVLWIDVRSRDNRS